MKPVEPLENPNPSFMVDPPAPMRWLMSRRMTGFASPARIAKQRQDAEAKRQKENAPHTVHYFHQLDDPYSHLAAQVLAIFAERYDIEIVPHLIHASGGKNQPELEKLAKWAHTDAGLIAPHYGLTFPSESPVVPDTEMLNAAAEALTGLSAPDFIAKLGPISHALWAGDKAGLIQANATPAPHDAALRALEDGTDTLKEMGHYSGATFHYGGEWYWGVDRLFHLEQRLRDLGAAKGEADAPFIVTRPSEDVTGIDASALTLDFYPSLNSPYTSIIFDRTIALKNACGIQFNHKPVLPMIMRGVPITNAKGNYICFDTKREADWFGVPFGPICTPLGEPTRNAYSLLAYAKENGRDEEFMSATLSLAFAQGENLLKDKVMRQAVETAGLDWAEAKKILGNDGWKDTVAQHQDEMVEGMGLWGVPSFKISGGGVDDVAVWGQDRLWLIAAEIKRRTA